MLRMLAVKPLYCHTSQNQDPETINLCVPLFRFSIRIFLALPFQFKKKNVLHRKKKTRKNKANK